ncbi:transposable element Tcb1 transposase [Trichonephila clavipes]|nr:transposable element Tcb1 transposase [Trichonephila clavipes]
MRDRVNALLLRRGIIVSNSSNSEESMGIFKEKPLTWVEKLEKEQFTLKQNVKPKKHRFTTLETISNYRNSYPGFSSGRPRETTPADDRYIVLQARRNRRQTAGEIARHTTQATGRPISRFTVARRLHGGGLFARRPVRCVPLTPAHRRRRSLWCREHRKWRDNESERVLFTDESRLSLSSDSHCISSGESGKPQSSLEHH